VSRTSIIRGDGTMGEHEGIEQTTRDFEKEMQPSIDAVMDAYKKATAAEDKTTYTYILLGKALLNCRMVLRSGFKDHINLVKTGIPDKQVKRYMKLVACPSCYDDLSKKPNSNDNTKLKIDSNINGINDKDITTLNEQSMNKLVRMKEIFYIVPKDDNKDKIKQAKADFEKVMKGDDTKYAEIIKKQKDAKEAADKAAKDKAEELLKAEYLETGLTKEEYELYKAGGDKALEKIQKVKNNEKWLKNQVQIRERKISALRLELIAKDEELSDLQKPNGEAQDAA
jgi:hypothetical protein